MLKILTAIACFVICAGITAPTVILLGRDVDRTAEMERLKADNRELNAIITAFENDEHACRLRELGHE